VSRPNRREHSPTRALTGVIAGALSTALALLGPMCSAAGMEGATGCGARLSARPQWVSSGLFPFAVAPVDWAVPRGYRGTLVREPPSGFPAKLVALTFDDGPDGSITPRILEALAAHRAQATFFVLGARLLRRMATTRHAIGNHSYSHPAHPSASEAERELRETGGLIREVTGRPPSCFRPPYGITKNALTLLALRQGYAAVLWTVLSADDRGLRADAIAAKVVREARPGDIVLMHDGPGRHETARAVPTILETLTEAGFQFVTIPQLLQAWEQWLQGPVAPCSTKDAAH
jgi:peptidoglycan/xylan/chitin deacetylase (PgdA/CDA1 family)